MTERSPPGHVRTKYLHGRPGPHVMHGRLAASVGAEFSFIDHRLRWQDLTRPRVVTVASWWASSATLPDRAEYNVFLVDNLHIGPVLMKRVFLRPDQKIVAHLGSHTIPFLHMGRFSGPVERLHLWALQQYDALLCEGAMTEDMVHDLLGHHAPRTYVTFLGPPAERGRQLRKIQPDLQSKRILLVASGPGGFRIHYKGLDLMVAAVVRAAGSDPEIRFDILGHWDEESVRATMEAVPPDLQERIRFRGRQDDIGPWMGQSALYLHCSRGDAFPTASIEAMTAGLVPIVSELTGTRDLVREIAPGLVTRLSEESIAQRILWFFSLPLEERRTLSARARVVAERYTEEAAIKHYRATFNRLCADLHLSPSAVGAP